MKGQKDKNSIKEKNIKNKDIKNILENKDTGQNKGKPEKSNIERNKDENSNEKEKDTKIISFENVDFENQSQIINSPRSLKACENLGIRTYELYKLTKKQFKEKYPDVFRLSDELFKFRYDSEEKFRLTLIKLVIEERKKIIQKEELELIEKGRKLNDLEMENYEKEKEEEDKSKEENEDEDEDEKEDKEIKEEELNEYLKKMRDDIKEKKKN